LISDNLLLDLAKFERSNTERPLRSGEEELFGQICSQSFQVDLCVINLIIETLLPACHGLPDLA